MNFILATHPTNTKYGHYSISLFGSIFIILYNQISMQNRPLISVIIACHNNESTLKEAVMSIVQQTYDPLEIIIVDDFSSDKSFQVAQNLSNEYPNVSCYKSTFDDLNRIGRNGRNINAGYSARNFALSKATGEWITFQDADDFSLLNRIEVEYMLAKKYNADHVLLDWFGEDENLRNKSFDIESFMHEYNESDYVIDNKTLSKLAKRTKGYGAILLESLYSRIPFYIRTKRVLNRWFYGSFANFPGTGNSPLFKRSILEKVKFEPLSHRVWPSFVGRGADRDFNFRIAHTYGNSFSFKIPLYVWVNGSQNDDYKDHKKFIV